MLRGNTYWSQMYALVERADAVGVASNLGPRAPGSIPSGASSVAASSFHSSMYTVYICSK